MATTKELFGLIQNHQQAIEIQAEQIETITTIIEQIDLRLKKAGL